MRVTRCLPAVAGEDNRRFFGSNVENGRAQPSSLFGAQDQLRIVPIMLSGIAIRSFEPIARQSHAIDPKTDVLIAALLDLVPVRTRALRQPRVGPIDNTQI